MPVLSRPLDAGRSENPPGPSATREGDDDTEGRTAEAVHGKVERRSGLAVPHPTPFGGREAVVGRREGVARPARVLPSPASSSSPTGLALRANPFPEVTDLTCRLPLPTSIYRQRLFTLETCCGYGYGLARKSRSLPRFFKGRRHCTGHRQSRGALRERFDVRRPYLRPSRFQGVSPLQRKENSSRECRRRHRVRLRRRAWPRGPISAARFGNINPTPFRL